MGQAISLPLDEWGDPVVGAEVAASVDLIEAVVRLIDRMDDPEVQHSMEDQLHSAVLQHIADFGDADGKARQRAAAALATSDSDFPRWRA